MNEGFAQFYATAAWNSMAQTTGWFYYYKDYWKNGTVTFVDVENGPVGGDTKYLENNCTGGWNGRGVELDWQRTFWDYMTNAGTKPSKFQLLRQIKNGITGGSWSRTNAYQAMVQGISSFDSAYGTSFSSRWHNHSTYNGIDH